MAESSIIKILGGRFVRIYTSLIKRVNDIHGNLLEVPIIFEGYLLDEDDTYYYLSPELNMELITTIVKKENELAIEDVEMLESYEEQGSQEDLIKEAMQERNKKRDLN